MRRATARRTTARQAKAGAVWLIAGAIGILLGGCGVIGDPGPSTTETRAVEGVSAVDLRTSGNLSVNIGGEPSLTITAGENVVDRLRSEVQDGVLVLDVEGPGWGRLGQVQFDLTVESLEAVSVSGSGQAALGAVEGPSLEIDIGGSGSVTAKEIELDELATLISGSGQVDVAGRAARQEVEISGSGTYSAADLESEDAVVLVSGSGNVDLTVSDTLDAEVSGSGSVTYSGGASVSTRISGSGSVQRR